MADDKNDPFLGESPSTAEVVAPAAPVSVKKSEPSLPEDDQEALLVQKAQEEFLQRRADLEKRRAEKVAQDSKKVSLPSVKIVYIPGTGVPSHAAALFGEPFSIWLTPNEPTEVAGFLAKGLACEFPNSIFLSDDEGNPRPFPASMLTGDRAKAAQGAIKK
jgi:hypothetical protein